MTALTYLKWEPDADCTGEAVEFCLTYAGPLLGASRSDSRADHKHQIRKRFHRQLKRLWTIAPHFAPDNGPTLMAVDHPSVPPPATTVDALAAKFERSGYNFVPLVTEELSLKCDVHVLFLRPDPPGSVLQSGDIDNRLKTLFDAMRMPNDRNELGRPYQPPTEDEKPFFCLLEDDSLITRVSVETDILLEPVGDNDGRNDARLVIRVNVSPLRLSLFNMHLG